MNPTYHLTKKQRRRLRIRAKIHGTKKRPRLSVFRSNNHLYAQLIDDDQGHTLVVASDHALAKEAKTARPASPLSQLEIARLVGVALAQKATKVKISQVVFDRGHYAYHGRVKALAAGARQGGLKF